MSTTSRHPRSASLSATSSTSLVDSSFSRAGPAREPQCWQGWSHFIVSSQTAYTGRARSRSSSVTSRRARVRRWIIGGERITWNKLDGGETGHRSSTHVRHVHRLPFVQLPREDRGGRVPALRRAHPPQGRL